MEIVKNAVVEIEITGTLSDGGGVGHADRLAVFVPGAAVGDRLRVRILKVKKSYAYGKMVEIVSPSPHRVEAGCTVFPQCGGCAYRHITYEQECAVKWRTVADALRKIGGLALEPEPILPAIHTATYRNKAQYPFGTDREGNVVAGFYAKASHRIVPHPVCPLHPEEFTEILNACILWANQYHIPAYDERTGKGILRHLYLRKGFATGQILVVPVINANEIPRHMEKLTSMLCRMLGDSLAGVVCNFNREKTNVVLGKESKTVYGLPYLIDRLCELELKLSPLSFYQVNREMCEVLYSEVIRAARPEGKTVLDLYCGAGTIGLSMAGTAKKIIGVEIVPQAVRDARENAQRNGIANAEFLCAPAAEAAETLRARGVRPDIVLLDPPRKGCDEGLIHTVASGFSPERVVYVSCDPATLARDLARFAGLGYRAVRVTPADLFPRTPHVETVVKLSLKKDTPKIEVAMQPSDESNYTPKEKASYPNKGICQRKICCECAYKLYRTSETNVWA